MSGNPSASFVDPAYSEDDLQGNALYAGHSNIEAGNPGVTPHHRVQNSGSVANWGGSTSSGHPLNSIVEGEGNVRLFHSSTDEQPSDYNITFGDLDSGLFNMSWPDQDTSMLDLSQTAQPFQSECPQTMEDLFFDDPQTLSFLNDMIIQAPNHFNNVPNTFPPTPSSTPPTLSSPTPENPPVLDDDEDRWQSILARSHIADKSFLFGVVTTKIFCRPSCAARHPARKNIIVFPFPGAIEAAKAAGFRPCKRCKPEIPETVELGVLGVLEVLRFVLSDSGDVFGPASSEGQQQDMRLESLSTKAGISPFHFHRLFKSITLLTPGDLITASRALALGDALGLDNPQNQDSSSPSSAQNQTQLNLSTSTKWKPRSAKKALGGVPPVDYASGGSSHPILYFTIPQTSQGPVTIAWTSTTSKSNSNNQDINVLTALLGSDAEARIKTRFPRAEMPSTVPENITGAAGANAQDAMSKIHKAVYDVDNEHSERIGDVPPELCPWIWRCRVWVAIVKG